jgi:hypothetical protein
MPATGSLRAVRQPRQPGIMFPELADPVDAHLDRFLIQHAVAARGALPYPRPAQFGGEHRRIGTGMPQLFAGEAGQVLLGHEPRVTADGRNRGSRVAKFLGRGRHKPPPACWTGSSVVTAASHLNGLGIHEPGRDGPQSISPIGHHSPAWRQAAEQPAPYRFLTGPSAGAIWDEAGWCRPASLLKIKIITPNGPW